MPVSTASKWFVNESKMNQTWWVYEADESPCPGNCCAAQSMDNDGVWRCGCGTWDIVQEAPKPSLFELRFPDLAAYNGQRLWGDVWYDQEEVRALPACQPQITQLPRLRWTRACWLARLRATWPRLRRCTATAAAS